jgi:hypothetical protein
MDALQAYVRDADLFRDRAGCKRWRECGRAAPASELTMRVSLVPHCTQPWVTSSRSFDAAPSAKCTGPAATITIRCPQCGQGRRRDDRCDGATSWQRMAFSRFPLRPLFPDRFMKVSTDICALHKRSAKADGRQTSEPADLKAKRRVPLRIKVKVPIAPPCAGAMVAWIGAESAAIA